MKDQLPSPDPDSSHYVRPSQNWICGKASLGQPCRIGPDGQGHCRATCECSPILEIRPGETKGRYKCTRPAEYGGPCESGPRPDGSCCRQITRCQPVRSLRSRRKVFTTFLITATVTFLLLSLGGKQRWNFISPGTLSSQHSGDGFKQAFASMHPGVSLDSGCAACHAGAHQGPAGWVRTALKADPGPLRRQSLALTTTADMTTIDRACENCHTGHTFHEPNVVEDHSCSACHQEHLGAGLLKKPADSNCESCHGDAGIMQASAERGAKLQPAVFNFRPDNGRNLFRAPRPANGYTKVIHSFATDHPEFQALAEGLKDPDTLKFNHHLHLTSTTVPKVNGRKLDCADCHVLDTTSGRYHQRISFEQNCKQCHSLQFDSHNPELNVPHGSPQNVVNFLRSLPKQYADYGAHKFGYTRKEDSDKFVLEQMKQIREQVVSGEELERHVFFGDTSQGRAKFPACTYCHEVTPTDSGIPNVTKPVIMDRWLIRGSFDHSKHTTVTCAKCHTVADSTLTSDILLPSKALCVECHSPRGGVANGCSTCHSYHAPVSVPTMKPMMASDGTKMADAATR